MDVNDLKLTDRVAVVTGAGQGIGKATAMAMAQLGARLAVCDMRGDILDTTVAELEASGAEVVAATIDVRDAEAVEGFMATVHSTLGPIDVLVNNAGGGFWSAFDGVNKKGETMLINENYGTVTNCIRSSLDRMNDGASIVNVTSVEAYHSAPGFAVYASMKAAVQQLTQSLAVELGHRGIRINCVAPDMIPTPGDAELGDASGALIDGLHPTPLQRWGSGEECAAVICFLASDLASFVTGSSIPVDGGTVAAGTWKVRHDGSFGM